LKGSACRRSRPTRARSSLGCGQGWVDAGGSKHDKFEHADRPDVLIIIPRHKQQSPGVARSIARVAGWM
jgi:hypothetical protein